MIALENSRHFREWGRLLELKFREKANSGALISWINSLRGVDYNSQKELLEDLTSSTEENKTVKVIESLDTVPNRPTSVTFIVYSLHDTL